MKKDIIVIGAGHAGCEAALIGAKKNQNVLLITLSKEKIAFMPCNPAIGGPAKGIVVREIDAMNGMMGRITNRSNIQVKMLNTSKGPAVRSLRAQADKDEYARQMRQVIENDENIEVLEAMVDELVIKNKKVIGVKVQGELIEAKSVIVTTGTYLDATTFKGTEVVKEGPAHEPMSKTLSDSLKKNNIATKRFKTGTPPRLDKNTINWDVVEKNPGDERRWSFSFWEENNVEINEPCYLTYTNEKVHEIIRNNFHNSPMYAGDIVGVGPRYCPSIEDKVKRFADKERHQLFLEPDDLAQDTIYLQGFSTSFGRDIQDQLLANIKGLEKAKVVEYGYAIEYDVIDAINLKLTLEYKDIENLYFAGQINGTSGYEEAAAQGLVAGMNATLKNENLDPLVLNRSNSYIGTMIDDITTKGVSDPYRLLTSRSEYRLILRSDNADERLTQLAYEKGFIDEKQYAKYNEKMLAIKRGVQFIKDAPVDCSSKNNEILRSINIPELKQGMKAEKLLKRPAMDIKTLEKIIGQVSESSEVKERIEVEIKYEGYIERLKKELLKSIKWEKINLPSELNYHDIDNIALEAREKWSKIRPNTLAQAARISGVNATDVSVLQLFLKREYGI